MSVNPVQVDPEDYVVGAALSVVASVVVAGVVMAVLWLLDYVEFVCYPGGLLC